MAHLVPERAAVWALLVYAGGAVASLAESLVLGRVLGAEELGRYAYALSWVLVVALLPRLGLDMTVLRYAGEYRARGDWGLFLGVTSRSVTIAAVAGGVLAGLSLLGREAGLLSGVVALGMLALPLVATSHIYQAALRSLGIAVGALAPGLLVAPVVLVAGVYAMTVGGLAVDAPGVMALKVGVFLLVVALLATRFHWQAARVAPPPRRPSYRTREWLVTAWPLLFMSGLSVLQARVDLLMLGWLRPPAEVGVYAVAATLAPAVSLGLVAANTLLAPRIAALYQGNDTRALQLLLQRSMAFVTLVTVLGAFVLVTLGGGLLNLYGPGFSAGYASLLILGAGQAVNALMGSVGYLMTMTGHQRQAARYLAASLVVNVVLNGLLIPSFGMEGAAAASALSLALWNIALYRFVRRHIGVDAAVVALVPRNRHGRRPGYD